MRVATVSDLLAGEGYGVEVAADGDAGYAKTFSGSFDVPWTCTSPGRMVITATLRN